MRKLFILNSSSLPTPRSPSSSPLHHHLNKPKTRPPFSLSSSSNHISTVHSPPLLSTSYTTNYLQLAAKAAEEGHFHQFLAILESFIASSQVEVFSGGGNVVSAFAKGVCKNLRKRNVQTVVQVLNKVDQLGFPPFKLFDAFSMDLLKIECSKIVNFGDLHQILLLMETLAGFSFPIKQLVDPSAVINICVHQREPLIAVRYARLFEHEGILICSIIKKFAKKGDLNSAIAVYEGYVKHLSAPNMYVYRAVIDACGLCGDFMKSRYIYEDMLNQKVIPNIYVFNSLMNVNSHDLSYTLHLYKKMQNLGVSADMTSYNILLKSCSLAGKVDLAQDIYREVKQLESTGLLQLDDFTYCTIIKIFADAKLWQLALNVKEDMLSSGITPNTFTWSSLMSSCANVGLIEQSINLFEEMILAGCEPNGQCCNILLHACVETCQYDRAFRLFNAWKGGEVQDTFSKDCSDTDDISSTNQESVPVHVSFIKKFPFTPSLTTYNTLMKACGSNYNRAKAIMEEMKSVGLTPNHISWSILIDICGSSGKMESAIQILKNMRLAGVEPDVIAYTTAIKVSVESKNLKMAFLLFAEMKRYQLKPNLVTYETLLKARTRYGSLKEVRQCLAIYQDMRKAGYKPNDYYLKQLIEEWCEGVIQNNNKCREEFEPCKRMDFGRPHSLLLEKVAAHLHANILENLSVDLQGLTKVEARIVVLAVLRMVKENYIQGHSVNDDMWITLGTSEVVVLPGRQKSKMKDAVFQLLQDELGLEVFIVVPKYTADKETQLEIPLNSYQNWSQSLGNDNTVVSSPRRPIVLQRLKVTRNSLHSWLQRRVGAVKK